MTGIVAEAEPVLGITHLLVNGQLIALLRCPFCSSFRNIHVEEIVHHIRFTHPEKSIQTSDFYHKLRATSVTDEELKIPWIRCLWCKYQDKIEWDLAQHMFEKHRQKVYELPTSSQDRKRTLDLLDSQLRFYTKFEPSIEFRLEVAVMMSKKENRRLGVKHAVRQVQKRILKRQQQRERAVAAQEIAEADRNRIS